MSDSINTSQSSSILASGYLRPIAAGELGIVTQDYRVSRSFKTSSIWAINAGTKFSLLV